MAAAQGRFTAVVPGNAGASVLDPQSWHGYSYVLNSPYGYVDEDGELPIPVITGIVGVAVRGVLGGGFEAANQWRLTGSVSNWGKVVTSAFGGALAGGISGATLGIGAGAGLAATTTQAVVVNASASVVGGIAQRQANEALGYDIPPVNGEAELENIAIDAFTGALGGVVGGRIADKLFPMPNLRQQLKFIHQTGRRHLRADRRIAARYAAQGRAAVSATVGGVNGGLTSEGVLKPLLVPMTAHAAPGSKPKVESRVSCFSGPGDAECPK